MTGVSHPASARPFLKWAGGKSRLAEDIIALRPPAIGAYHEPFVGGGGVFFALRASGFSGEAALADASKNLIDGFVAIRDEVGGVVAALGLISAAYLAASQECRASIYYALRGHAPTDSTSAAARTIFLNKTGYNGLYRVNRAGQFNVPHGRYANPRIVDEPNLRACSAALENTELRCEDFEVACNRAQPGDFVYLDPPYQPLSKTSAFTSYTAGSFGPGEQLRLRDCFESLTARGVAAVLSNSDHDCMEDLYGGRGFTIDRVSMSRSINSVGSGRAKINELLISNRQRQEVRAVFGD